MASSNPLFIGAPDIDVVYSGSVDDSGNFSFNYKHYAAPSHEMYVYNYPGDMCWTLFRHPLKSFNHLFPWMPGMKGVIILIILNIVVFNMKGLGIFRM